MTTRASQLSTAATFAPVAAVLALALVWTAPAAAQVPDISGQWELTAEVFPVTQQPTEGEEDPCSFAGSADISQDGSDFSGAAELGLLGGPAECPVEMDAGVSGEVDADGNIEAAMLDGMLGTAFFSGQVGATDGIGAGGSVGVETGPFGGSSGTWAAVIGAPPVQAIPTLTGVGLTVLLAVLAVSALFVLRRRAAA